jgi:hypothetical protein
MGMRISIDGLIMSVAKLIDGIVRSSIWGHRRICSKTHSKRHRGMLSGDFGGAESHAGAALWAKCNHH